MAQTKAQRQASARKAAETRKRKAAEAAAAQRPPAGVTPPERTPNELDAIAAKRSDIAERAATKQRVADADQALADLEASVTQKEWLLIMRALDANRQQINADGSLRLLALSWVKRKREQGGASWDELLNMTDEQILEAAGFSVEDAMLASEDEQGGSAD